MGDGKQAAGQLASTLIEEGMTVGLGTGSTAHHFIAALGIRCNEGLGIKAVATSKASETQANECGIPVIEIDGVSPIAIAVDVADEIDPQKRMIKGGGGALLREKIVDSMSDEMVVIIDASKQVDSLGAFPLPVEIVPFGYHATIKKVEDQGFIGSLRSTADGSPFITDNGNYIFDINFGGPIAQSDAPESIEAKLQKVVGVVETGLFIGIAGRVIVGHEDGTATLLD